MKRHTILVVYLLDSPNVLASEPHVVISLVPCSEGLFENLSIVSPSSTPLQSISFAVNGLEKQDMVSKVNITLTCKLRAWEIGQRAEINWEQLSTNESIFSRSTEIRTTINSQTDKVDTPRDEADDWKGDSKGLLSLETKNRRHTLSLVRSFFSCK